MRNTEIVIANAHAALRPGGRLEDERGVFGNVSAIVTAMNSALEAAGLTAQSPWDFPSPSLQKQRLKRAGLVVTAIDLLPRPTPPPTGI